MAENVGKNLIDGAEYPATQVIVERCVSMIAKLWNADESLNATGTPSPYIERGLVESDREITGTPTTGSSEAIQLAGLASEFNWASFVTTPRPFSQ